MNTSSAAETLARRFTDKQDPSISYHRGVVSRVGADGVEVRIDGDTSKDTPPIPALKNQTFKEDDVVDILQVAGGVFIVIGKIGHPDLPVIAPTELTDTNLATVDTPTIWGPETNLVSGLNGIDVNVYASLTGRGGWNSATVSRRLIDYGVQISLDGGSTWEAPLVVGRDELRGGDQRVVTLSHQDFQTGSATTVAVRAFATQVNLGNNGDLNVTNGLIVTKIEEV